jgi:hypothetical protein
VFKHGGGATKKVLCCLEFRGACRKNKRRKNNIRKRKKEKER